jgi:hypothetical protein
LKQDSYKQEKKEEPSLFFPQQNPISIINN